MLIISNEIVNPQIVVINNQNSNLGPRCFQGCLYTFVYMEYWIMQERKRIWRPGGETLAPSVPVKDCPLSGPVIEFELY